MPEYLIIGLGFSSVVVLIILVHLRHKRRYRISNYYHHDNLMGAQCSACGEEMRIVDPKYILSYEDKQQAEEQVQYWIAEHRREHGSAG